MADAQPPVVEFFWDPGSPYTYLASTRIQAVTRDTGALLRWRPFLLGGVFQATGNSSPVSLPAKARYLREDLAAWADYYGVPLNWPEVFPGNSMLALRAAVALEEDQLDAAFARAVMQVHWDKALDIASEAVITNLVGQLGADAPAVMKRVQSEPVKRRLRAYTEEAIERGAFGAPTFFVGEKMFWGNDRIPLLHAHLKQIRPA
jgi:2-hydroxychromene-2-carboxylate isomerase